jgi:hypothetical protein
MIKKASKEIVDLSRLIIINLWKSQSHSKQIHGMLPKLFNWVKLAWLPIYLRAFFRKTSYPTYTSAHQGIFKMSDTEGVSIALCSDWATDTKEADEVGFLMAQFNDDFIPDKKPATIKQSLVFNDMEKFTSHADYTIHLGDIYYIGTKDEVDACFDENSSWSYGKQGSFVLSGNHEMYSGGNAFYQHLIKQMGTKDIRQEAGYFCLENRYWRIIGLDTGYHSVGIPFFNKTKDIPKSQKLWLKETVKIDKDNRGIILLSHHQYYSAFEKNFPKAASSIARMIPAEMVTKRPFLWFWGHEHRLSLYGCHAIKKGVNAYGRCIGNGGMPQTKHTFNNQKAKNYKLLHYDAKQAGKLENKPVSRNGYARLSFLEDTLRIEYVLSENVVNNKGIKGFNGQVAAIEKWKINTETGTLQQIDYIIQEPSMVDVRALIAGNYPCGGSFGLTKEGFYRADSTTSV